jgi:hypothetical protein
VRGLINVRGTANSESFESYQVQYQSPMNPGSWTTIGSGDTPVLRGVLAEWDTSVLVPGLYIVRLRVVDSEEGDLFNQISVLVITTEDDGDEEPPPPGEDGGPPFGNGGGRRGRD